MPKQKHVQVTSSKRLDVKLPSFHGFPPMKIQLCQSNYPFPLNPNHYQDASLLIQVLKNCSALYCQMTLALQDCLKINLQLRLHSKIHFLAPKDRVKSIFLSGKFLEENKDFFSLREADPGMLCDAAPEALLSILRRVFQGLQAVKSYLRRQKQQHITLELTSLVKEWAKS